VKVHKIVFAGGPGTGKSETLKALNKMGCHCFGEISRQITKEAQQQGIDQLFLKDPLLFSQKLLEGRVQQYLEAEQLSEKICFFDRGIPEITAYMHYKKEKVPAKFIEANHKHQYDQVFIFPIWHQIYTSDNERYESLEEALIIEKYIRKTYEQLNYDLIDVPQAGIDARTDFILNHIHHAISK